MRSKSGQITAAAFVLACAALLAAGSANGPTQASGEVEVVSLMPHGFEPREISRPQGPFLLVIRSYDHISDHAFDAAVGDAPLLPASILKDDARWTGLVDLQPGEHVLRDHDHAERLFKITIRP